ncbi:MAG: TonB-dependent receptor [Acidobacteriota bacterium]
MVTQVAAPRRRGQFFWMILGLCAAVLLTGLPASAQEATEAAEEAEAAQDTFTEEVTVTARKREESLQEVPFSVVAPTEDQLRERGAVTREDVSANVAGFTVQNLGPGQSQVAMRGVSAGQIVRDQPGVKEQVGVYLDESVISLSLFTPDIDLFDMNRVEVLRGPQGTLFGSGSLSGTVRYISNQPELGISESFGEFALNSIDDGDTNGDAKVAVNVPMGENAAMRFVGYYTGFGGYIDAVQPGLGVNDDVNGGERIGGRLSFRFEPNEKLTITPRIIYQEIETDGWNRIDDYNILANPFTTTRPSVNLGERQQFTQLEETFTDEFFLFDLNIDYEFDNDLTLTSITSFTQRDVLVVRDATALTASITGGSIGLPEAVYSLDGPLDDATEAEVLTQELRLSGSTDRVDWVAGLFYSSTEREYGQSLLVDGFEALSGIPTQGLRAPRDVLFFSDLSYDLEQTALFGELTYAVNDKFDLTAGLRFYDFDEDRDQIFDGIFGNDDNGTALVSTPGNTSSDGIAPRLIASYQVNEEVNFNAQVSKGIRLGGINDPLNEPLCTPQDLITFGGRETWEDEELWNYEVGVKRTFQDGRGVFNIAAFFMDIEDLQATVTAGSCSSRVIFNVPEAESRGIEVDLTLPINYFFDISISASFIDSELKSTLTSVDADGGVSVVSGIEEGNRLPTVPEMQLALAASYRWEMKDGWAGYAIGTFQHVGERFTQIGDQAEGFGTVDLTALPNTIGGPLTDDEFTFDPELPSYEIVNLRLGFVNEKWEVAAYINNLTDEIAFLALDQERGTLARVGYLTNQPRTFGVSTRVKF